MLNLTGLPTTTINAGLVTRLLLSQRMLKADDVFRAMNIMRPLVRHGDELHYVNVPRGEVWPRLDSKLKIAGQAKGLIEFKKLYTLHVPVRSEVFEPDPLEALQMIPVDSIDCVFGFEITDARPLDTTGAVSASGLHLGLTTLYIRW